MTPQKTFEAEAHRFSYNPETGQISRDGLPVGSPSHGYLRLKVMGRSVPAHRAAWFLTHGAWPQGEIDHINGNRADNRIANLRDVSPSLNRMNQRLRSDNSSGVPGVTFHRTEQKWHAQICERGHRRYLGRFSTRDAAVKARLTAQAEMAFGPNHGAGRA